MASTWLICLADSSTGSQIGSSATGYSPLAGGVGNNATEANAQTLIRDTYTASNLWARTTSNGSDGTTTIRTRKAAANGGQSVSFAASVTGTAEDTVNTDAMATGELWNYSIANAGTGVFTSSILSLLLQHAGTGNFPLVAARVADGFTQSENLVRYLSVAGSGTGQATEANAQYTFRVAATLSNFRVYISANSIGANTSAATRKNAGAGGQSVTITASTTGSYEDTVNTDSVVAGDEVNYVVDSTSAKMGSLTTRLAQVESTAVGRQLVVSSTGAGVSNVLVYWPVEGLQRATTATTEANVQLDARTTLTIENMYAYVSANTRAANTVVAFRKNGASAGPTVTFGSSVTGVQEDTVNTTTVADGDLINYSIDGTAAAGTTTFQILGVEETQPGGANTEGGEHPFRQEPVRRTFALVAV